MLRQLRQLRSWSYRAIHTNADRSKRLSIKYCGRPVVVFTAGAPGSGKSYTLHHLFGLEHVTDMIDLDSVMPRHPDFDAAHPARLYDQKAAYRWADQRVEANFTEALERREAGQLICLDGTGTNIERQKRRIWAAKDAGFWTVQLSVEVSIETALRRNASRERTVPEAVLRDYGALWLDPCIVKLGCVVSRVPAAIEALEKEKGMLDELIVWNNDDDDTHPNERARWGDHYEKVWDSSQRRKALFETGPGAVHPHNY